MNPLNLNFINRLTPYKVWTEDGCDYFIETTNGHIFIVGFMDDYSIWSTGAYQFTINNPSRQPSPNDHKLRDAILLLIEAFFAANPDILLYRNLRRCILSGSSAPLPMRRRYCRRPSCPGFSGWRKAGSSPKNNNHRKRIPRFR